MYKTYQVENNETLNDIAAKLGTDLNLLKDLNGVSNVSEGDLIVIPNRDSVWYQNYTISAGDTLYSIAIKNDISLENLLTINGLEKDDYIYPNNELLIPKKNIGTYITKMGDTLNGLTDLLNVSFDDIIKQNEKIYLLEDQLIIYKK